MIPTNTSASNDVAADRPTGGNSLFDLLGPLLQQSGNGRQDSSQVAVAIQALSSAVAQLFQILREERQALASERARTEKLQAILDQKLNP
jgi:hypothetical protein